MSKRNRIYGSVIVGGIVLTAIVVIFSITQNNVATVSVSTLPKPTATPDTNSSASTSPATLQELMGILADDDPYYGPEDAPVIMVEFSDYLCPWCGAFYFNTLPQILNEYSEQVRYVHRDYPVLGMFDEEAPMRAAIAAGCALAQGRFWDMHSALLEPYRDMDMEAHARGARGGMPDPAEREAMTRPYTAEGLRETAEAVGLDMEAYDACVANQTPAAEIQNDLQHGMYLEINSVPTYIINGYLVQGSQSFEVFSQIIDEALTERPLG